MEWISITKISIRLKIYQMKKLLLYILPLALLVGFTQCDKDETPEETDNQPIENNQKLIEEGFAIGSGLKVELYALTEDLYPGYNQVFFTVKDSISGEVVEPDEFIMHPMMEMMSGMMHSCPMETPTFNSETKQYEGAITFVMSSMMGSWTVSVHLNGVGTADLVVPVMDQDEPQIYSFPSMIDSTTSYFVSLIQPEDSKVGENTFEVLINKRASMMDWPAMEEMTVVIKPEMPDMGHGSPNNVDPVHTSDGHYNGVVNFTMTGWWRVHVTVINAQGDTLNNDRYFDITFQ